LFIIQKINVHLKVLARIRFLLISFQIQRLGWQQHFFKTGSWIALFCTGNNNLFKILLNVNNDHGYYAYLNDIYTNVKVCFCPQHMYNPPAYGSEGDSKFLSVLTMKNIFTSSRSNRQRHRQNYMWFFKAYSIYQAILNTAKTLAEVIQSVWMLYGRCCVPS
jgi:hypothetical protein